MPIFILCLEFLFGNVTKSKTELKPRIKGESILGISQKNSSF